MRPSLTRVSGTLTAALGLVALTASAARAGMTEPEPPAKCFRGNGTGELPTCTWNGSTWQVSYDDFSGGLPGPDVGAGFAVFFVLAAVLAVAGLVWRVSLARQMATESGMDPDRATAMTLLSDDGLDATYLASSLRGDRRDPLPASEGPAARSVEGRLRELADLRDRGLVTQEEHDARRTAILDSL